MNLSVGTIISGFQSQALAGVGLFLTGYRKSFAPGSPVADCEERQAELAQRLGATVYRRFDEPGVTHVMAGKSNTNNMLALKWVRKSICLIILTRCIVVIKAFA